MAWSRDARTKAVRLPQPHQTDAPHGVMAVACPPVTLRCDRYTLLRWRRSLDRTLAGLFRTRVA
eukprot:6353652-Pyramimonas_sp.AAC.1